MHLECFLGKPKDSQKSSLMGVSLWASANKVVGVALPKSLEFTTPCVLDEEQEATGLILTLLGFTFVSVWSWLPLPLSLLSGKRMLMICLCILKVCDIEMGSQLLLT